MLYAKKPPPSHFLPSTAAFIAVGLSCIANALPQHEEVVVTAQKRDVNLQDIAISGSAAKERDLDVAAIKPGGILHRLKPMASGYG